jgi:hypothetical protein
MGGFSLALLAGAQSVSAQNTSEEYREWQRAQRQAQEEYQDYLRTRSRRDYRDWQQAQRIAQREYNEYQRVSRRGNTGYYNNSGYYNNNRRAGFYRINRGGSYYEVDQRQYALLQQAVNAGYQQGYNAGVRDRRYGYGGNYYMNDRVYRTGTYGYQSYVNRDLYQYYFQQGFQRGYQDGVNNSFRYGSRTSTGLSILGNVLGTILQLAND